MNELDTLRLREALALAESAFGVTEPNPRVGCIVGHADGRILGTGATQHAGGPHAEIMALRFAQTAGHQVRGATAWVTLEPCSHHGRTPPCCEALIDAGIARVVVAVSDPFPAVNGRGIQRLRDAGIQVDMGPADLAIAAREVNIGFFSRHERGRPWVRLKVAASLDGRTALPDGSSQWITGPEARADGHAWRRRASAVLTGIGTVLADQPRLDVRLVPTAKQPLRVILDTALRLPPESLLLDVPGPVLVFTQRSDPAVTARLQARGAEVVVLPGSGAHLSLPAIFAALAERGLNEIHVEAGATLNGALLCAGMADELLVYIAPVLIGEGLPMAHVGVLNKLSAAQRWRLLDSLQVGADLRLRLRSLAQDCDGVG
jgi:diaminohydroxyphosphoribosylaminopyrimidine deaminase/5-amino-6-(5-phosphoribosylamino)uracil reductase